MSPFVKLRWYARHRPVLIRQAASWVGLKELVLHRLTGRLVTELSSASGTGLLDIRARAWDPEAIRLAGIRLDQLPEVQPTTATLPLADDAAAEVGLPAGTPVVTGAGDGPLGNLGAGATEPGVAGLSIGTSGALRLLTDTPYADPTGRLFCYALTEDQWAVGTALSNGGSVARWAATVFADGADDEESLALAEAVPAGSDGLITLPFLLPERGPSWNPDLRGAFLGVRQHHTPGHFIRSAVEGVGLQLAAILDGLEELAPVGTVRATGGVFRSELWRRVIAAALDRPLVITEAAEGTALGAAALGLYALDIAASPAHGVTMLASDSSPEQSSTVMAAASDVATYRALRRSVADLATELAKSGRLLTPSAENPA
jgi:gluconokinase